MHEHAFDPLRPHRHDPNPTPPSDNPNITFIWSEGRVLLSPDDLRSLPSVTVPNCLIVSTGHGTSGPFAFTGVALLVLIDHLLPNRQDWHQVAAISGDGFGTRFMQKELTTLPPARPALLAYAVDGYPLTRQEGLVRLIEPNESDDALRQVKWIATIEVK